VDSGGWWGSEPRLVLRTLRPDALAARRAALTPERREELHLLISHLLEHADAQSLGQRYLRFHHLFAGGNWEEAAAAAEPLLKAMERRGRGALAGTIQDMVVSSNLVHHIAMPRLLHLLHQLGAWESARGGFIEGQSHYERASERLFQITDTEAATIEFDTITPMILAHADLLERPVGGPPPPDLLHPYLDPSPDRLTP